MVLLTDYFLNYFTGLDVTCVLKMKEVIQFIKRFSFVLCGCSINIGEERSLDIQ